MKSEKEKSGRFLIVAIFFLLLISTAQGAWDNDDLMYAKGTSGGQLTVHNIDTEEDFETIQAAIDDLDTKDGHTISVDAGIYPKPGTDPMSVVINKQLKLIGVDKDNTIIDGDGSGNCIKVTADNVEIRGFTIKNGDYGIYLESSNCRVIDNNIISIDFDGIFLSNSINNTIAHNSISEVKRRGIRLSSSCNNRIHDNDLSENDEGIVLFASPDNIIYHNNFIDNRIQAKDNRDTNRWDNGSEDGGNYWSDHECTGNPSNGSVSQRYIISGGIRGATDFYPFMDKDGWTCTLPSPPTLADPGTNDTDGNYTVSWSSVTSATNYTLEEDTSSLFSSPTKVYSGSETSKEITGKSDGTYYYQVKARNECGWSKWSNKEDIKIKIDTIPPVIYHENITNATGGESIPISATITDSTTKVANANLSYRITSEGAWITISMDHVGDNYSATIPASHVTTAGVEYYIEAVDDVSNTANKPATAPEKPYSIIVIGESSVTISVIPSTINLSESVNISGIITRAHSANVTLTFTTPNNATPRNSTTSTANGSYYFVFPPEEVGKWTVNATWAGDSDTAGNTSKTVSFTVRGESSVTISVIPSTINLSESVNISGNISLAHSANVTLTFTTPNGSIQKNSTTSAANGCYYFVFRPEEVGNWTVNATWAGDSGTAGNTSKTVSFIVNADKVCYAIIIAGRNNDLMQSCYDCTANSVYKKLLPSGFTNDSIFYLNPSMKQDVDGDDIPVDRISSLRNISYAINTWAWGNVSANDSLLIYMVGHCNNKSDKFIVNGANDALTASYLNNSLNQLTNARGCDNITVVCEACNSGSFIYNHSCKGRIIVTSTGVNADSMNNETMGGVFSYYFFDNISTGKTIKDAFEAASKSKMIIQNSKNLIDASRPPQTPLLDDNGDGNGSAIPLNNDTDGSLAACRYICTQRNGSGTQGNGHSSNSLISAIRFEVV